MSAAEIGALAALAVGVLGLIGVPISAQVTGMVSAATERTKRRATHESDALGTLLRAWVCMDTARARSTETTAYRSALADWQTALAEIAAYSSSTASAAFAAFIRAGADASDAAGQTLLVNAIFAVRRGAWHRRLPQSDRGSIAVLLFGGPAGTRA